jgi:hypothetical protein
MQSKDVLIIILPIITGILGSYLTYYFTIKSKKQEAIQKFKEEKYTNLILMLQGFVGSTVSKETKKKFYEEQYKSWLYSSDDVVQAINELTDLLMKEQGADPDPVQGRKVVGNIILQMRKDLLGKTKLKYTDFRYTDVR